MKQTNSKGVEYILQEMQTSRGKMRFFGKSLKEGATEIELPEGYEVGENERTGLLFLRKKK